MQAATTSSLIPVGDLTADTGLRSFFEDGENEDVLRAVFVERRPSLRLVNWFVTCYCKHTRVNVVDPRSGEAVDVAASYDAALRFFGKWLFDPFDRHNATKRRRQCNKARRAAANKNGKEEDDTDDDNVSGEENLEDAATDMMDCDTKSCSSSASSTAQQPCPADRMSVRQMYFFRWAIASGVMQYLVDQRAPLYSTMRGWQHRCKDDEEV